MDKQQLKLELDNDKIGFEEEIEYLNHLLEAYPVIGTQTLKKNSPKVNVSRRVNNYYWHELKVRGGDMDYHEDMLYTETQQRLRLRFRNGYYDYLSDYMEPINYYMPIKSGGKEAKLRLAKHKSNTRVFLDDLFSEIIYMGPIAALQLLYNAVKELYIITMQLLGIKEPHVYKRSFRSRVTLAFDDDSFFSFLRYTLPLTRKTQSVSYDYIRPITKTTLSEYEQNKEIDVIFYFTSLKHYQFIHRYSPKFAKTYAIPGGNRSLSNYGKIISPHISIWYPTLNMLYSITHRVVGVLAFSILAVLFCFYIDPHDSLVDYALVRGGLEQVIDSIWSLFSSFFYSLANICDIICIVMGYVITYIFKLISVYYYGYLVEPFQVGLYFVKDVYTNGWFTKGMNAALSFISDIIIDRLIAGYVIFRDKFTIGHVSTYFTYLPQIFFYLGLFFYFEYLFLKPANNKTASMVKAEDFPRKMSFTSVIKTAIFLLRGKN